MAKKIATPTKLLLMGLLIAGFYATPGCKKKETATTEPNGTWTRDVASVPFKLSLNNDKTYAYSSSGVNIESGTYAYSGGKFGFEATAGPGFLITADYDYTLSSNTLMLAATWDTCNSRSVVLNGTWKKE